MAFADYAAELVGYVPKLPILLAQKLVNRAWRDIREHRPWTFLTKETVLTVPALVNTGAASVTQYSTFVTMNAAGSAAITGLANPILTLRQFRVGGGPIYNIIAADFTAPAAVVLTLDKAYQEPSNATAQYQIYRCYYAAPDSNFLRWVSVFDPVNAYRLKLHWTKAEIDQRDPQRGSQGQPYYVASYKLGNLGAIPNVPFFELWPHPVAQQSFFCLYQERGADFADRAEALPAQIPEDLLMYRARYHAYEWAEANKGTHAELQATDWMRLRTSLAGEFRGEMVKAERQDEECFLQMWTIPQFDRQTLGPVDAAWLQSHAGPWG